MVLRRFLQYFVINLSWSVQIRSANCKHRQFITRFLCSTAPTALIVDETPLFIAAQQYLVGRNFRVPEQVSLVSTDYDASLRWCRPPIAHIRWHSEPIVRRIVRWAKAVSQHRADVKQVDFPAEFVPGGTIGPVWKG